MRKWAILASGACIMSLLAEPVRAEPLTIVTDADMPPYAMKNGDRIVGFATELVRQIMARSGLSYQILVYPWRRSYETARVNAETCLYSTIMTEQRLTQFKWVGPLTEDHYVLFALADSPIDLSTGADLKAYRVGGDQSQALAAALKEKGIKLDSIISTNSDALNLKRLQAGHIDLWAVGRRRGTYVAKTLGLTLKPILVLNETKGYLACNKAMSDEVIATMNAAVKQMRLDGTMAAISKAYP